MTGDFAFSGFISKLLCVDRANRPIKVSRGSQNM